jgi:DNA modification methylase
MSEIINGDCLEVLGEMCFQRRRFAMLFADPPDNIGLEYQDSDGDKKSEVEYRHWLAQVIRAGLGVSPVCWWSVNKRHEDWLGGMLDAGRGVWLPAYSKVIWYYTFGQHRESFCGNNYRPIYVIHPADFEWRMSRVRIPSERQRLGDPRANPEGRVPGDVWGGPSDVQGLCRVQGNNKERRKWHPTQHPEKLIERIVLMSTDDGDDVIDPFMGTGTTLRVCDRLGRNCTTIDRSATYCANVAAERQ